MEVHPQEISGEQRTLGTALAALDFHDHVTTVIRVPRNQQAPKLLLRGREFLLECWHFRGERLIVGRHFD